MNDQALCAMYAFIYQVMSYKDKTFNMFRGTVSYKMNGEIFDTFRPEMTLTDLYFHVNWESRVISRRKIYEPWAQYDYFPVGHRNESGEYDDDELHDRYKHPFY